MRSAIIRASNYLDERYYPVSHHLFQAILFSAILVMAWISSVQSSHIVIFGHSIPSLCMFKNIITLDCPGCGITRSFVYAVHGRFYESYMMHLWGVPLTAFLMFQVGYRFWRASGVPPIKFHPVLGRWFRILAILSILLPWGVKTVMALAITYYHQ